MVAEKQFSSVKSFFEKIGKRNLILAGAALIIGAAVWLNWSLFADGAAGKDGYDGYDQSAGMTDTYGNGTNGAVSGEESYFASTQVSRKRARDEALEVLQSVVDNSAADESVKAQALADINAMALTVEKEANIETLIKAKGFEQCVAVLNGESATIVVNGKELMANQISQINEIVYDLAKIEPVNITIIGK